MKRLERLAEGSHDELARRVLRSAKRDAPPTGNRERFLASLGAGAGVGVATPVASALVKASGLNIVIKWLGIGAVAGLVSAGVALELHDRKEPPAPVPASAAALAAPRVEVPRPAPLPPQPALARELTRSEPTVRNARPAARTSLLDEEVAALDRARNALRGGDSVKALAELEAHNRRFPAGVLGPEAEVLRIEALAESDPKAATALAQKFLRQNPQNPLAARVRAMVSRLAPPETFE